MQIAPMQSAPIVPSLPARLPDRLRSETRALHTAAERSRFMSALLRGRMLRPAYCALLRNLQAIYAALEPALAAHVAHAVIAPLLSPAAWQALWRRAALAADLQQLHGADWAEAIALQPATVRYVERLHELDARQPELLLAHAYVRYLGDLSGGQMLGRIVSASVVASLPVNRTATAAATAGTAFYDFGDAAQTLALTQEFRAGLGAVVVDAATADALVGEARLAFELHSQLFDELALACGLGEAAPTEVAPAPA